MKPLVSLFLLATLSWSTGVAGAERGAAFNVQLIRGTDQAPVADASWKPLALKLCAQFDPIFRWKYHGEVSGVQVRVMPGKCARVRLSP